MQRNRHAQGQGDLEEYVVCAERTWLCLPAEQRRGTRLRMSREVNRQDSATIYVNEEEGEDFRIHALATGDQNCHFFQFGHDGGWPEQRKEANKSGLGTLSLDASWELLAMPDPHISPSLEQVAFS